MTRARRLAFALLAATLRAGLAGGEEPARLVLDFRGADLAQVVRSIAQDTGRGFVFDERLQGRVTIAVPDGVTHAEAIEVLHAALRLRGFAALPAPGGVSRILPLAESAGLAPLRDAPEAAREGAVTTLVRLRHADAAFVAGAIEPLVGTNGSATVVESSNSIVLASSESALRRLLDIVHALDRREPLELAVLRLRWRGAEEVEELVTGVFGDEPGSSDIELVSDARTQALVVEAPPEELAEIRAFVRGLDRPEAGRGGVHVVRVRNVDPEDLAERLNEMARPSRGAGRAPDDGEDGALALAEGDWSIAVDRPTRSLLVVADAPTFAALSEVIAQLDVTPPLVSVEVQVVEIDSTDSLAVAIDALVLVSEPKGADDTVALVQTVTSGTRVLSGPEVVEEGGLLRFAKQPLRLLGLDAEGDEVEVGTVPDDTAAILARQRRVDARLLLRPHLLVASGEEQEIFAGANIPIPVAGSTGAAGGNAPQGDDTGSGGLVDPLTLRTNIERQDVGVRMRVKPTVGAEGGLRLDLEVEATRVGESTLGDVEEVGPTLLSRELTARLHLADGEVAILGGLGAPSRRLVESGVPFLMDVPFFGQLFRSTREEQLQSHLVVAVQGRVLRSPDDLALESIRRRLAFERSREGLRPLEAETDAPWAVLVATRAGRGEAEAVAAQLGARDVRVVGWELGGLPRFDVFVTGFAEFADACAAARGLARQGWLPEVVALLGSVRESGARPGSSPRGGAKP
jgi:general secretion pathway protein D